MPRLFTHTYIYVIGLLLFAGKPAFASSPIDAILAANEEPPGVVFEIVTGKGDALNWALPQIKSYIDQLRARFPDLPIAIVTHGQEQFALQKKHADKAQPVHSLTQQLGKEGITLHVCGTYAGWKGVSEEDFPDYVNVSPAGPAQINDYKAVGYVLVKISRPQ